VTIAPRPSLKDYLFIISNVNEWDVVPSISETYS